MDKYIFDECNGLWYELQGDSVLFNERFFLLLVDNGYRNTSINC